MHSLLKVFVQCFSINTFFGSSPIARPGHLPDIARCPGYGQCPEYGQFSLSIFRTSTFDVRDMASKNWPYPGHQNSMSGMWPVKTGHIPDIKNRCQGYGQLKLAISRTSLTFSVHIPDITVYIPDITVLVPDITVLIPDIIVHIPDIIFSLLSTFRTSKVDVRNMDSILCPYSGHQRLMSGTWTVFSVHVPDIKERCPGHGQFSLSTFRTTIFQLN